MAIVTTSYSNDGIYFFDVEGIGFKVSRRLFSRHQPTFAKLLKAVPFTRCDAISYGRSIRHPIPLYGHTADQFSLFLHALSLVSLPHPLELSLADLLSIAELAHRYDAYSIQTWALNGLTPAVMLAARDHTNSPGLSSQFFIRVLRLALSCEDIRLANMAQSVWTDFIHRRELPPAPAIAFADKHGLVLLQIHAYYAQLLLIAPFISYSLQDDDRCPSLNASQRTHLMEGYYSLSSYWNHLRNNAPSFPQSSTCSSHDHRICISTWRSRWGVMADWPLKCDEVDVLRRLAFMGKALESDRTLEVCMSKGCREMALGTLKSKLKELGENPLANVVAL